MAARSSPLVSSPMVVWLVPVKNAGGVHYARRAGVFGVEAGPALCGAMGDLDRYARPRWRKVKSEVTCNWCHANACTFPSRVDRS